MPIFPPLHSNIVLTPGHVSVVGASKANPPFVTQEHTSAWNEIAHKQATGWSFRVTISYGFKLPIAWAAYLQTAYLLAYVVTDCSYVFTKAGIELRRLLTDKKTEEIGTCIITPPTIGVGGKPWIAEVVKPTNLRCLWAKVAGNVVILPLPDDDKLTCYKAWQQVSQQTAFGLSPKTDFRIIFQSEEDALEAQRCITISPKAPPSN